MKNVTKFALGASLLMGASMASAAPADGKIYIVGEALSYTYSLDEAQALLARPDAPSVFTGTIYLKGNEDFKFMDNTEWGGNEYGVATDAAVSGKVDIVSGNNDEGYNKLKVAESGNYYMVIDTENLTAEITKSVYQETEIKYCSLFLVGSATAGGWSVDNGTPLYQEVETPYVYANSGTSLKSADGASFKIVTALKGGGSFDAKYFFFRDADNAGKISTDSTDDRQWSVSQDGDYEVSVNTDDFTITINKVTPSGIDVVATGLEPVSTPVYYNLAGNRVDNPASGIYIEVSGGKARKVVFE